MPDTAEISSLVLADWAEGWKTPANVSFLAAFVRGISKGDDAEAGRELRERGTLTTLSTVAAMDESDVITRSADNSRWMVSLVMPAEHGMRVYEIERMTRITMGKM